MQTIFKSLFLRFHRQMQLGISDILNFLYLVVAPMHREMNEMILIED